MSFTVVTFPMAQHLVVAARADRPDDAARSCSVPHKADSIVADCAVRLKSGGLVEQHRTKQVFIPMANGRDPQCPEDEQRQGADTAAAQPLLRWMQAFINVEVHSNASQPALSGPPGSLQAHQNSVLRAKIAAFAANRQLDQAMDQACFVLRWSSKQAGALQQHCATCLLSVDHVCATRASRRFTAMLCMLN